MRKINKLANEATVIATYKIKQGLKRARKNTTKNRSFNNWDRQVNGIQSTFRSQFYSHSGTFDFRIYFRFSLDHKRSYDSAYDSDSDSVASENQPLWPLLTLQFYRSTLWPMDRHGALLLLLGNYKISYFFQRNHMLASAYWIKQVQGSGFPSIFLGRQPCYFEITLASHLIRNNVKIQHYSYIWGGFIVPSHIDTVHPSMTGNKSVHLLIARLMWANPSIPTLPLPLHGT